MVRKLNFLPGHTKITKLFKCENRDVFHGRDTKDTAPLGGRVRGAFVNQQARARVRALHQDYSERKFSMIPALCDEN